MEKGTRAVFIAFVLRKVFILLTKTQKEILVRDAHRRKVRLYA